MSRLTHCSCHFFVHVSGLVFVHVSGPCVCVCLWPCVCACVWACFCACVWALCLSCWMCFVLSKKCTCWICVVELGRSLKLLYGVGGKSLMLIGIHAMGQHIVWISCLGNVHIHHLSSMSCGVRQIAHNTAERERPQKRPGTLTEQMHLFKGVWIWPGYLQPRLYFVGNPDSGLLKTRSVINHLPYIRLDYCMYGSLYWKEKNMDKCSMETKIMWQKSFGW